MLYEEEIARLIDRHINVSQYRLNLIRVLVKLEKILLYDRNALSAKLNFSQSHTLTKILSRIRIIIQDLILHSFVDIYSSY